MDESESIIIYGDEENGDEFYEKIEAPKFVDLTAPDPYQPGEDRSWFCLRVGCDQNHDEEMDSETVFKNFVLRVMAARSPNIRLQKSLCRKDSGLDAKCPRTVPAKLSKSRVTRIALISSISKRLVDTKVKVKPLSKQNATPKVKAKAKRASDIAKALTTPRSKKQLANPEGFRSVRNPKTTANAASNSRVVAKTLVFDSPKKAARAKISVELNTPLKTLCAEMKKLEITSGKKKGLGYNRPLPSNTSRKQFRGREVKSRVFDGLLSQNAKTSKCLEKNKKANNVQKNHDPMSQERIEKDVNDKEIEEKTKTASQGAGSTSISGGGNISEGNSTATEISRPPSDENNAEGLSDASRIDSNSLLSSGERSSVDDFNVCQFQPPEEIMERDDKGQTMNSDNKGNDSEAMESDDKENALASDENRELGVKISHIEHKSLGRHEIPKGNQKTATAKSKQSKESSAPVTNDAQCLKLKKPKPTNPKPFRLRTDERGILKEANLEKKLCPTPLCEIAAVRKVAGGNLQEKHQNAPQRDAKCLEQNENHNDTYEDKEKERQDDQSQNRTLRMKIAKERMGRKKSSTPQRHTISSKQKLVASQQKTSQDKSTPKSETSLRKSKSPSVRQLSRVQEEASRGDKMISMIKTGQLGTIKETSPTILRATAATKPRDNGASVAIKASVSPASRRPKTIPKEPNFHTIHTPKICTRRVA